MKYVLFLCSFFILSPNQCNGANILSYTPIPSYSHQIAFRPLWKELAKRGHKITLLTTDLMEKNDNITQVNLSEVYKIMEAHKMYEKISSGDPILEIITTLIGTLNDVMECQLSNPQVQRILKNKKKIDLVITEYLSPFGLAFAKKLKVPVIGVVSMDAHYNAHEAVGNPTHPVANPSFDLSFSAPLSFKERVLSTLYSILWRAVYRFILQNLADKALTKYVNETINQEEEKKISMVFINANPIFNTVRPLGPKTVNVGGGIHLREAKPLPKDLQDLLDNAENGVIYFSLGSNVKSNHISNKTKRVFLKTFSQLPYQILWKFEDGELLGKPKNVEIRNWIPQQDVLRHKNIKLFITQGGLQSMEEAIFNYVPMVGLPFFGDQHNNIKKMVQKGFGLSLDHSTLEVEAFTKTILKVLNNPSFKQKTKELADLVLDQPMTGLEKAVWWTEYVLRHGGTEHFRNPVVDLPLYQYYLLDVISFLLVVILLIVYVLYKILQLLWKISVNIYLRFFVNKTKIKAS